MITANELRDARNRAGYTSQAALAEALGVSERTVTNWEAEGGHVSARAEARVRSLLWPAPGPLSSYSSYELLSELGRRLDAVGHDSYEPETNDPHVEDDNSANVHPSVEGESSAGTPPKRKAARGWGGPPR